MSGITDLLYVRFRISDLEKQKSYLETFGCQVTINDGVLIARGTDADAYLYLAEQGDDAFLGLGFEAQSQADLERIARLDSCVVENIDLPGGGYRVRLVDPDGFDVDVVWGIETPAALNVPGRNPVNNGEQRTRLGQRVVLELNDVFVKRLGHCVLNVKDFPTSEAWYKKRFGLLTSDEVFIGTEDRTLGAFLRLNRGETFVDHHTLFLVHAGKSEFNHAAFEVADWDNLMLGQNRLNAAGCQHQWGVGKHKLGSQVFNYWKDPNGFTLEHFTDGDLFNESFGSHKAPIEDLLAVHWGPEGAP